MHRLLRQSTLFPLFEMFCGARFAPADARAVDDVLLRLPKRIVAESGWTRVCPPCIVEDWRDYGTPIRTISFWRRGTVAPHVVRGLKEEHAYKARASLNSKPHQFARFARRLLEAEFAPVSKDRLVDLYRLKLKQLGLFRKHTIDRIALERERLQRGLGAAMRSARWTASGLAGLPHRVGSRARRALLPRACWPPSRAH
jgi:hypothetical protein